jgi:hypothetical protein
MDSRTYKRTQTHAHTCKQRRSPARRARHTRRQASSIPASSRPLAERASPIAPNNPASRMSTTRTGSVQHTHTVHVRETTMHDAHTHGGHATQLAARSHCPPREELRASSIFAHPSGDAALIALTRRCASAWAGEGVRDGTVGGRSTAAAAAAAAAVGPAARPAPDDVSPSSSLKNTHHRANAVAPTPTAATVRHGLDMVFELALTATEARWHVLFNSIQQPN